MFSMLSLECAVELLLLEQILKLFVEQNRDNFSNLGSMWNTLKTPKEVNLPKKQQTEMGIGQHVEADLNVLNVGRTWWNRPLTELHIATINVEERNKT